MEAPEDMFAEQPAGDPPSAGAGDVIAGKYQVERVLGEGGMGIVVAAMHVDLQERVAIKLMLPSLVGHSESAARFVREARATFGIKSEHVARLLDFGKLDDGSPFMVMEYLEGETLAHHLDRDDAVPPARAVDMVIEACAGVADAHRLGIIHRDLKPENLFLARAADGRVVVKVLDFGISKADLKSLSPTRTEGGMGTPAYAAPEQLRCAGDAGPGADIWSLGVVLFELCTGRLPFKAGSFAEMCAAVLTQRPPEPRSIRPSIPEGLQAIILRCLAMEPEARFATVSDLVLALASYATEEGRAVAARVDPRAADAPRKRAHETPEPSRFAPAFRDHEEGSLSGCESDATPALPLLRRRSAPITRRATALAALTCALVVLGGGVFGHGGASAGTGDVSTAATIEGSILSVHSASEAPSEAPHEVLADGASADGASADGAAADGASEDRVAGDAETEEAPASSTSAHPAPSPEARTTNGSAASSSDPPRVTRHSAARAAAAFRGFGGRK